MTPQTSDTPLLIAGAGGLGREILAWVLQARTAGTKLKPVAFCDDRAEVSLTEFGIELPVLSTESAAEKFPNASFLVAIGDGQARQKVSEKLTGLGLKAATFVHPSVIMGARVVIGEGTMICAGTVLTTDITIGRHVLINCSCNIGHDVKIGSYTTLLGNNSINGEVRIGDHVLVGSAAAIHPRLKVGDQSKVGIGSVVIRNVAPNTSVFGVPAMRLS